MSEGSPDSIRLDMADEAATLALGGAIARAAGGGALIYLQGDLGAGKTTFCRGVLRGLGFEGAVKSPTYTLVEPYELAQITVYHFDLYRLVDPEELEYMGIRDYLQPAETGDGLPVLALVEWPEKGGALLPKPDIVVDIQSVNDGRLAELRACTARGELLLKWLNAKNISNISQL